MDKILQKAEKICKKKTGDNVTINDMKYYIKWVDEHYVEDKDYNVFEFSLESPDGKHHVFEVVFDEENEKFIGYYLDAKDVDEKVISEK